MTAKYLAVETWGLCDFRGITALFDSMEEAESAAASLQPAPDPCYAFRGALCDPGEVVMPGQWMAAQDGCVFGPYESLAQATADAVDEEFWGVGPIYRAKIVKIQSTHSFEGKATIVILEYDA